ncbi:MAG: NADPH-dependent F420 reductase [Allomuricauda sp.]
MEIAFIGIGNVGFALANNLQKLGHKIVVANDNVNSKSVQKAVSQNPNLIQSSVQKAVDEAEMVFLAVPFAVVKDVLSKIDFVGKILVDCTNPVGPGISHSLDSKISGSEKIQEWTPSAKVVKAFTIYGFENFEETSYPAYGQKPVMLIASDYMEAKVSLTPIINSLGFKTKDTGPLSQALHLEHMTLLWVKMVRRDGHHPNFVWGYMER